MTPRPIVCSNIDPAKASGPVRWPHHTVEDMRGRGPFQPLCFVEFHDVHCFRELARIRAWCVVLTTRWRFIADGVFFEDAQAAALFATMWNGRTLTRDPNHRPAATPHPPSTTLEAIMGLGRAAD